MSSVCIRRTLFVSAGVYLSLFHYCHMTTEQSASRQHRCCQTWQWMKKTSKPWRYYLVTNSFLELWSFFVSIKIFKWEIHGNFTKRVISNKVFLLCIEEWHRNLAISWNWWATPQMQHISSVEYRRACSQTYSSLEGWTVWSSAVLVVWQNQCIICVDWPFSRQQDLIITLHLYRLLHTSDQGKGNDFKWGRK